mmetsp:Transcript_75613/g.219587  ORF Transcript_75613/g.219587 Transcript_75613/m.219587 type:complete len:388 (-) Transcript_75613:92-1255(-)
MSDILVLDADDVWVVPGGPWRATFKLCAVPRQAGKGADEHLQEDRPHLPDVARGVRERICEGRLRRGQKHRPPPRDTLVVRPELRAPLPGHGGEPEIREQRPVPFQKDVVVGDRSVNDAKLAEIPDAPEDVDEDGQADVQRDHWRAGRCRRRLGDELQQRRFRGVEQHVHHRRNGGAGVESLNVAGEPQRLQDGHLTAGITSNVVGSNPQLEELGPVVCSRSDIGGVFHVGACDPIRHLNLLGAKRARPISWYKYPPEEAIRICGLPLDQHAVAYVSVEDLDRVICPIEQRGEAISLAAPGNVPVRRRWWLNSVLARPVEHVRPAEGLGPEVVLFVLMLIFLALVFILLPLGQAAKVRQAARAPRPSGAPRLRQCRINALRALPVRR